MGFAFAMDLYYIDPLVLHETLFKWVVLQGYENVLPWSCKAAAPRTARLRGLLSQLRQHIAAPLLPLLDVQHGRRRHLFILEDQLRSVYSRSSRSLTYERAVRSLLGL